MSRTSIRKVAVAWTAGMTAVGTIVGISLGSYQLSLGGKAGADQASVTQLEAEQARQTEVTRAAQEAEASIPRQAALRRAETLAAQRRAATAAQAAARAAAVKAAAAKDAAAKDAAAKDAAAKDAAAKKAAREAAARAEEAEQASRSVDRTPVKVDPGSAQDIARKMVTARGWSGAEFNCLVKLWNKESGWRVNASNPSGAYGIPQALPGSKMASAGDDWRTNAATQITWGLGYIEDRYDTPCGAWGHFQRENWY